MIRNLSLSFRHALLVTVALAGVISMAWLPAMPQNPDYHQFADQRSCFGINHFFNVISNLPFIAVGIAGLIVLFKPSGLAIIGEMIGAYRLFFTAIVGVGVGSGYYHWAPDNGSLIWDRLPMTVAFMAFFSVILAEFVSIRLAESLFYPLVLIGAFSAGYWYWTELIGQGDLRLYGLVQFLPLILIPLILLFYSSSFTDVRCYWFFFEFYVLAKIFEYYDAEVFKVLEGLSGHTLKHLVASLGCAVFLMQIKKRSVYSADEN